MSGNRVRCVDQIKEGNSLEEIQISLGVSLDTIIQYLNTAVGEGRIRRSDIYFAIPAEHRKLVELAIATTGSTELAKLVDVDNLVHVRQYLELYLALRDARLQMGDMYEYISSIELTLHAAIQRLLSAEYGPGETGWWRKGVPPIIRKACASTREDDEEPAADMYNYTTFIHLKDIMDKQWLLFVGHLPKGLHKSEFLDSLIRLNTIRNRVMHPVKAVKLTEDDFEFVRRFHTTYKPKSWS